MNLLNVQQGSQEWHEARAKHFTASEAPAMMGASKYQTRDQLLAQKKTGIAPEVNGAQQRIFDQGHEAEEKARPIIENQIGEQLFPATGTHQDKYLASFDGITMDECIIFEHKLYNDSLAEQVKAGQLDPHYYWQLEHQLFVSDAQIAIFVVSDGSLEKMVQMEYHSVPERREALLRGWAQFEKDLETFEPAAQEVKLEANVMGSLPALNVRVSGEVTESNLDEYKEQALVFIKSINRNLVSDQDFADAEAAVKWCGEVETKIKLTKEMALAQTSSIDQLFKALDEVGAEARRCRLDLDRLVKSRKEARRGEIVQEAQQALMDTVAQANAEFPGVVVRGVTVDFWAAIKGKRNFSAMQSAVNDELAKAKISLSEKRDHIRKSMEIVKSAGDEYKHLFHDLQELVEKDHDHLKLLVGQRVADHKAAEEKRINEEAERRAQQMREKEAAAERAEQEAIQEPVEDAKPSPAAPVETGSRVKGIEPSTPAAQSQPAGRPTDAQIISVLALHYRVHESKVVEWLLEMDLEAESNKLAQAGNF